MSATFMRPCVLGGNGFLGRHLVHLLQSRYGVPVAAPRSAHYDLRRQGDAERLFGNERPSVVFHLAALCGGIKANQLRPADFLHDNAVMGLNVVEAAKKCGVPKLVLVGTTCSYPAHAEVPIKESALWTGYPEATNAPYGLAKRLVLEYGRCCREQYGLDVVAVIPANLYGPGDHFDATTSHVVPAIIRKAIESRNANLDSITLWGTGKPTRDLLYVEDAAEGILAAATAEIGTTPVNLGSGTEISIRALAELICGIVGFRGLVRWDATFPDGQLRRCLDVSKAEALLGWRAKVGLVEGLERTVAWYEGDSKASTLCHQSD